MPLNPPPIQNKVIQTTGIVDTVWARWFLTVKKTLDDLLSGGMGTGDMVKATYDPANIAQQVLGTTATQTVSGKTIALGSNSISGTKAQFDTACTNGNFLYVGDVTQYTDELAQDAVGAMIADTNDIDLAYSDATPSLTATLLSTAITAKTGATPDGADYILISDTSDSGNLKKALISDLPSGGSSAAFIEVEKDLGSAARTAGQFTITGLSGLTTGKPVNIFQAVAPYTGKGTLADEAEMDNISVKASVTAADTITAYWNADGYVKGNFKFNYLVGA